MNEGPPPIDAELLPESTAVAKRDPLMPPPEQPRVTAAQARIEAVADLTKTALAQAATLKLSQEETNLLIADFPDEAFKSGAAGKENLIYIEHAALRDRLNTVLGLGQWAVIVRETWNEPFKTQAGKDAVRVYARGMLLVRGAYVGEAVGEMEYFPHNAGQNYGDAFEGAKTAAFRRCAKEFGIGLQAWRKDWGDGWWARKRSREGSGASRPQSAAQATPAKPADKSEEWKAYALKKVGVDTQFAYVVAVSDGWIMEGVDKLEDAEAAKWPQTLPAFETWFNRVKAVKEQAINEGGMAPELVEAYEKAYFVPPKASPPPDEPKEPATRSKPIEQVAPVSHPEGTQSAVGKIDQVTLKEGKKGDKPWSKWGIRIGETWFNSFSNTIGQAANDLKGKVATVYFTPGSYGNDIVEVKPGDAEDQIPF